MEQTTGSQTTPPVGAVPRLELVEHYAVPVENGLQVRYATHSAMLSGRIVQEIFPKLLPLLDGSRTTEQLCGELAPVIPADQLVKVLGFLKQKGLVRETEAVPPELETDDAVNYESLMRFFGRRGSRYATLSALRKARIGIIDAGPAMPVLVSSLAQFGVKQFRLVGGDSLKALERQQSRFYKDAAGQASRAGLVRERALWGSSDVQLDIVNQNPASVEDWEEFLRETSMVVVLLQGPLLFRPWLEKFNAAALSARIPWTSVALLDGDEVHVGPTIRPGVTACYKCFELRLKSNLTRLESNEAFEAYVHQQEESVDFGFLPPVAEIVAGFAAIEVARTLSPEAVARTSGKLMMFNLSDFSSTFHPVLKLPRCPACSPVRNKPRQRVWS